jgi:hypothetical protein
MSEPICTTYKLYVRHCRENHADPVSTASFETLMQSAFPGLMTKRHGGDAAAL